MPLFDKWVTLTHRALPKRGGKGGSETLRYLRTTLTQCRSPQLIGTSSVRVFPAPLTETGQCRHVAATERKELQESLTGVLNAQVSGSSADGRDVIHPRGQCRTVCVLRPVVVVQHVRR